MALSLVLIGSVLVAGITRSSKLPVSLGKPEINTNWRGLFLAYGQSVVYVAIRTVPLVAIGIWPSMWIMRRLPLSEMGTTAGAHIFGIATIALIAVLLTLPSLFEIPLALSIVAVGGPLGAAGAACLQGRPSIFHHFW